jgi:hypothetical protein
MTQSDVQTVFLSPHQARLILDATVGAKKSGLLKRDFVDEIERDFLSVCKRLVFSRAGLSMRLDACDPTDITGGTWPLVSVGEVFARLISSKIALKTLERELQDNTGYIKLYFYPWDSCLADENRYRVFCALGIGQITAIR